MLIAIISDTHMPRGARRLPDACARRLQQADLIVHAGDLVTLAVLEELRSLGQVVAVHGNMDDAEVRRTLRASVEIDLGENGTLAVIHDAGPREGRLERLRRRFPDAAAAVFGHSHLPSHERAADGFQIFNPGSPTERRRAPQHTMGIAHVQQGEIDLQLIDLD